MGKCKHRKLSLQSLSDKSKKRILCYARNPYNLQACELTCHGMKRVIAEDDVRNIAIMP
jgi:nitrate reductase beta subunit